MALQFENGDITEESVRLQIVFFGMHRSGNRSWCSNTSRFRANALPIPPSGSPDPKKICWICVSSCFSDRSGGKNSGPPLNPTRS